MSKLSTSAVKYRMKTCTLNRHICDPKYTNKPLANKTQTCELTKLTIDYS